MRAPRHFVYHRSMAESPDIASIAALIGDPARSRILLALMGGQALTATELSLAADVAPSTTSAHLAKLTASCLIQVSKQGRHRYFAIVDERVAELIEQLCGLARQDELPGVHTGPRDPALRRARVCYDHLAGDLGVQLFEGLLEQGWLESLGDGVALTQAGTNAFVDFGIDTTRLAGERRDTCRRCLDWSVRRHHLAGGLGAAILDRIFEKGWASKDLNTRAVHFTAAGERNLSRTFWFASGA